MKNFRILLVVLTALSLTQLGMGHREGQYDEEAREMERQEKALHKAEKKNGNLKTMATGVKQATVDSTTGFISDTEEGAKENVGTGTLEGARQGTGKVLDNAVRGAFKVATLGYGETGNYEVKEPEKGSDDTTKIKFKIPGT